MEIRPVATRSDLKRFIELPYRLYRDDPNWVAPLRREQWAQFESESNPMLDHCEYALFLLWDGEPIGRISAFGPACSGGLGRAYRSTWVVRVRRKR